MAGNPVIEFEDVSFSYNALPVLTDVNFSIGEKEMACIIGPNGGGKTTLLRLLLGILSPAEGSVNVFGQPPAQSRPRIGYMPQYVQYDPQFPVTVKDIVLMGRLGQGGIFGFFGWNGKRDHAVALSALADVEMERFVDRPFSDLSGGQRQRVLIARALSCEPDLLILDEPMNNVDRGVEERFLTLLKELNRKMTIVLVSHDIGFVSDIIESVVCVNRRVVIHPTSQLTGEVIQDIYSSSVRMVRHDHRCSEEGHTCD